MKLSFYILPLAMTALPSLALAKTAKESWHVKGITNTTDATKVQDAIKQVPGVTQVSANKSKVSVTFDDTKVDEAKLKSAVAGAGSFELTDKIGAKKGATPAATK
jgi:copper chaperone CopZ